MSSSDTERRSLADRIYNINEKDFDTVAIEVWKYQYKNNDLYHGYCDLIGVNPVQVSEIQHIPFLPVMIFREHEIKTGQWPSETIFKSSGTTGAIQSEHHIRSLEWYHHIADLSFTSVFGKPGLFFWLGLLPSYQERPDSSLVNMVHYFMHSIEKHENRFYLKPNDDIIEALSVLSRKNQPTILIGVSFALLDLFETYKVPLWDQLIVMETGGMKGRRQEMTRDELYERIRMRHPDVRMASEYGMTEMISQAYRKDLHFQPGPTMKVFIRDISDPLDLIGHGQRGAINMIDLGNLDTCAFLASDDVGITFPDGTFDVMGRLDQSDIRGCNLMYA